MTGLAATILMPPVKGYWTFYLLNGVLKTKCQRGQRQVCEVIMK